MPTFLGGWQRRFQTVLAHRKLVGGDCNCLATTYKFPWNGEKQKLHNKANMQQYREHVQMHADTQTRMETEGPVVRKWALHLQAVSRDGKLRLASIIRRGAACILHLNLSIHPGVRNFSCFHISNEHLESWYLREAAIQILNFSNSVSQLLPH